MVRLLLAIPTLVFGWWPPLDAQDEWDLEVALLELQSSGRARVQPVFLPYFDVADGGLSVEITVVTHRTAAARHRGDIGETTICRFTSTSVDVGSVGHLKAANCASVNLDNLDRIIAVTAKVREDGSYLALNCRREAAHFRSQARAARWAAMREAAECGAGFADAYLEGSRAGERVAEQERVLKAEMEAAWRRLEQGMATSWGADDARVYFCSFGA